VTITNNTFIENQAICTGKSTGYGLTCTAGAAFFYDTSALAISRTVFTANKASDAGCQLMSPAASVCAISSMHGHMGLHDPSRLSQHLRDG
jgi:hypothetical protein